MTLKLRYKSTHAAIERKAYSASNPAERIEGTTKKKEGTVSSKHRLFEKRRTAPVRVERTSKFLIRVEQASEFPVPVPVRKNQIIAEPKRILTSKRKKIPKHRFETIQTVPVRLEQATWTKNFQGWAKATIKRAAQILPCHALFPIRTRHPYGLNKQATTVPVPVRNNQINAEE